MKHFKITRRPVLVGAFLLIFSVIAWQFSDLAFVWGPHALRVAFPYGMSELPDYCPNPRNVLSQFLTRDQRRWDSRAMYSLNHDRGVPLHHYSAWNSWTTQEW